MFRVVAFAWLTQTAVVSADTLTVSPVTGQFNVGGGLFVLVGAVMATGLVVAKRLA